MSSSPVEIRANLDCDLDGKEFSVRSAGRHTVVEVPDVATGLRLVQLGSSRGHFWRSLHKWKRLLDSTLHRVEFRVRGRTVGVIGHSVGSRGWRLLGFPTLALKPAVIASELVFRSR